MMFDVKWNKLKIRVYIVHVQLLYKCIIFSSVRLFVFMIIYVVVDISDVSAKTKKKIIEDYRL